MRSSHAEGETGLLRTSFSVAAGVQAIVVEAYLGCACCRCPSGIAVLGDEATSAFVREHRLPALNVCLRLRVHQEGNNETVQTQNFGENENQNHADDC